MTELCCANCGVTRAPAAQVATIAVCAACGSSNVIAANGQTRRANAQDTDVLSPGDRALLVKARSSIVRPERSR